MDLWVGFLGRARWWEVPGILEDRQGHCPQPCCLCSPSLIPSVCYLSPGQPCGNLGCSKITIQSLRSGRKALCSAVIPPKGGGLPGFKPTESISGGPQLVPADPTLRL